MTTTINHLCYWNSRVYGNALYLKPYNNVIVFGYGVLAVLIPVIVPIFLVPFIKRWLPKYIRY